MTSTTGGKTIIDTSGVMSSPGGNNVLFATTLDSSEYTQINKGQIHTYLGAGDDIVNMGAIDIENFSHGQHLRGGGGNDIFDFQDLDEINNTLVGRFEDFDITRDEIRIDGVVVDFDNLPSNVRVVEFNGAHNDVGADPQQWILIDTGGGHIFYSLEGARIDMDGNGGVPGGEQEKHFLNIGDLPDFSTLQDVDFIDQQNFIPEEFLIGAGFVADLFTRSDGTPVPIPRGGGVQAPEPVGGNGDLSGGGRAITDIDRVATIAAALAHRDDRGNPMPVQNSVEAVIAGTAFADLIAGGLNDDTVEAGDGNDRVWGGSGHDDISGEDGADTLKGGTGDDVISGDAGNDVVIGGHGDDELSGGTGDDVLLGGAGADLIDGGTNDAAGDTVSYENSGADVRVNLDTGNVSGGDAQGDTLIGVENVIGSAFDDALTGDGADNRLLGGDGIDTILAGEGNDELHGDGGADRLFGLDGNDTISGGAGKDFAQGGNDNDDISGNEGEDTLFGNNGDDILRGGADDDELDGGGGNDLLFGDQGHDVLRGGAANDTLEGGAGNDTLKGGSGLDVMRGGDGQDSLFGDFGSDTLFGGADDDTLNGFQGQDVLFGEDGDDTLGGGDNADTLDGGAGNDILRGQSGNDELSGGSGLDTLNGGTNNDRIDGGTENDFLTGGDGNDTFVFEAGSGFDQIDDFDDLGNDVVDLTSFGFADFALDVGANLSVSGAHIDLDLAGDTLRFRNTDLADIAADDFILV